MIIPQMQWEMAATKLGENNNKIIPPGLEARQILFLRVISSHWCVTFPSVTRNNSL